MALIVKCPRCNFSEIKPTGWALIAGRQSYCCQHCDHIFLDHGETPKPVRVEPVRKIKSGPSFNMPTPKETGVKMGEQVRKTSSISFVKDGAFVKREL